MKITSMFVVANGSAMSAIFLYLLLNLFYTIVKERNFQMSTLLYGVGVFCLLVNNFMITILFSASAGTDIGVSNATENVIESILLIGLVVLALFIYAVFYTGVIQIGSSSFKKKFFYPQKRMYTVLLLLILLLQLGIIVLYEGELKFILNLILKDLQA